METNLIGRQFLIFMGSVILLSFCADSLASDASLVTKPETELKLVEGNRTGRMWAPWTYAGAAGRPGRFGSSSSYQQKSRIYSQARKTRKHRRKHHRKGPRFDGRRQQWNWNPYNFYGYYWG